jgi:hypothetical protein
MPPVSTTRRSDMLARHKGLIAALVMTVLIVPVAALAATGVLSSPDTATPPTIDDHFAGTSSTTDDIDDDHLATTSSTIDDIDDDDEYNDDIGDDDHLATTSSTIDDMDDDDEYDDDSDDDDDEGDDDSDDD